MQWALAVLILCSLDPQVSGESEDLASIIGDFWAWRIREWPEFSTKLGISTYNDRLENYTEAAFTVQKATAEGFLQRLAAVEPGSLSRPERLNADILSNSLQVFSAGFKYRRYGIYNYMSKLDHITYRYRKMLRNMPKNSVSNYENILARYSLIPQQLLDLIVLMRQAVTQRTTVHTGTVNAVIGFVEDELSQDLSLFHAPFLETALPQAVNMSERVRLQDASENIIGEIRTALVTYRDYLKNEYLAHARVEPGVGSLPGGLDYYKACLKWHVTADWTPQQVHQRGLEEVARIKKNMEGIMTQHGFQGTVREFIAHIKQDPTMFYNTSEAMLEKFGRIITRVHSKLHLVFHDVTDDPIQVLASPQRVSRYSGPTPDGSQSAVFWADVEYPTDSPMYTMTALTLHEAEPGHHLQSVTTRRNALPAFRRHIEYLRYVAVPFNWIFNTAYIEEAITRRNNKLPAFRRSILKIGRVDVPFYVPINNAYREGWALYAESLGEEMGVYTEPLTMFGRYTSEMYRAARLVVDTGIHALGWSVQRAEEYLLNNTAMGPVKVTNEVMRYVSWPGQACSYKIGELKIKELRKMAENKLGSAFDLRDYHHEVLSLGPVPLNILDQEINAWVADTLREISSSGQKHSASLMIAVVLLSVVTGILL